MVLIVIYDYLIESEKQQSQILILVQKQNLQRSWNLQWQEMAIFFFKPTSMEHIVSYRYITLGLREKHTIDPKLI